MRAVLGTKGGNQYPGFSSDPIDAFRHLAHDLGRFCQAFLSGADGEFEVIASRAAFDVRKRLP